jgi:hypothetical protein
MYTSVNDGFWGNLEALVISTVYPNLTLCDPEQFLKHKFDLSQPLFYMLGLYVLFE